MVISFSRGSAKNKNRHHTYIGQDIIQQADKTYKTANKNHRKQNKTNKTNKTNINKT